MSDYMQLFTSYGDWYVLDGDSGGACVPADLEPQLVELISNADADDTLHRGDALFLDVESALLEYYEGSRLESVELVVGWCARYSAPGYMDATSWCGPYATEAEAVEECKSVYADDDEDDEDHLGLGL